MKLPFELVLLASSTLAAPLQPRSATFSQLAGLTSNTHDLSTTDARFRSKYFHESVYHPHYDGRFASAIQSRSARLLHMRLLLRSYIAAMDRVRVRTWLMHGSLLGWWWNRGMFPWDSDLDFCVEERGIEELGGWWNMTVHDFTAEELGIYDPSKSQADTYNWDLGRLRNSKHNTGAETEADERIREPLGLKPGDWDQILAEGKKYLLEVNPHYTTISTDDPHNKIDARWIDTSTGLFIDITTVHPVPADGMHDLEEMYTKDTHLYTTSSIFPLRQSRFEGADVWVPYAYEQILVEEYGPRALVETWFIGYEFDPETKMWVSKPEPSGDGKGIEREGDGRKAGKKPKWKSAGDKERKPVDDKDRNEKDNKGLETYRPSPGKAGDVHVVPGSG